VTQWIICISSQCCLQTFAWCCGLVVDLSSINLY